MAGEGGKYRYNDRWRVDIIIKYFPGYRTFYFILEVKTEHKGDTPGQNIFFYLNI